MKKRVIGVVVLVALGVLIPLVLSHCMGGDDTDSDATRVYEITPEGDARALASDSDSEPRPNAADKDKKSSGDGFAVDGATGVPESGYGSTRHPEAISPSRDASRPSAADNDNAQSNSTATASNNDDSLKRTGPISGWVVQVASFGDEANARRLARRLKTDFDVFYRAGEVGGKTYYRVRIGPFDNESDARATAAKLRQRGRSTLVKEAG